MPELNTPKPSNLIFVSADNTEQASTAAQLFNAEAAKNELAWNAVAHALMNDDTEGAAGNDFSNANLIIALSTPENHNLLQQRCSEWQGKIEYWKLESKGDEQNVIKTQLNTLLVRLILERGKRQPINQPDRCTQCQNPISKCSCKSKQNVLQTKKGELISIKLDKKARRGKLVTVATGFSLGPVELEKLAAALKKTCGSGGTAKDGQIEIQGDHRDKLLAELGAMGYKTRRVGG